MEITDGTVEYNTEHYRRNAYYDLAKIAPIRLARSWTHERRSHGAVGVCVTPSWPRSEMMLDSFGVTEKNWRDACAREPHFAIFETPRFIGIGRAVTALAADPERDRWAGASLSSGGLAREQGFADLDGSALDCRRYADLWVVPAELVGSSFGMHSPITFDTLHTPTR